MIFCYCDSRQKWNCYQYSTQVFSMISYFHMHQHWNKHENCLTWPLTQGFWSQIQKKDHRLSNHSISCQLNYYLFLWPLTSWAIFFIFHLLLFLCNPASSLILKFLYWCFQLNFLCLWFLPQDFWQHGIGIFSLFWWHMYKRIHHFNDLFIFFFFANFLKSRNNCLFAFSTVFNFTFAFCTTLPPAKFHPSHCLHLKLLIPWILIH